MKSLNVNENTWKRIQQIRLDKDFKTVDDVINKLIGDGIK